MGLAINKIILIVAAAVAVLTMLAVAIIVLCIPAKKKRYNASQNSNEAFQHGPNPVHVGNAQGYSPAYSQQPAAPAYSQQPAAPAYSQQPVAPVSEMPAAPGPQISERDDFRKMSNPAAGNSGGFASVAMQEAKAVPVAEAMRDDTTVLMPPDDATILLSAAVQKKVLHHTRTGEQIVINKEEFLIGRSSHGVDYRIADNNSVSRVHAKIILRSNQAFAMDLNAANGSLLNQSKMTPMQEYELHDGDILTLANEEFVYHL